MVKAAEQMIDYGIQSNLLQEQVAILIELIVALDPRRSSRYSISKRMSWMVRACLCGRWQNRL